MGGSIFPPGGGGGSVAPAGLPDYTVYAAPGGSSSSGGTQGAPKRYVYDAIERALSLGGGTVYYNDNTLVGGPVADQGIWLRSDGVAVPGFINIGTARIRICPVGNQGQYVFERPGPAWLKGGSTGEYKKPAIWVVGTEVPIDFQFVKVFSNLNGQGIVSPARCGWDYVRKFDGTVNELTVTNGNRSARHTTFTVDLASAQTWTVTSAVRSANVTQLTITRPLTVAMSPWVTGSVIRVNTGSDPDFAGGDYVVTGQSDVLNLQGETTITVTYTEVAANHSAKSISGTVKSHGCAVGDYIATTMASPQFPTCSQMSVTAVTATTVTVFDPYGYAPRSASTGDVANPGTLVKQLRGRQVASAVSFDRCSLLGYIGGASDTFAASPALDLGGTSASDTRIYQTYFTGGNAVDWPNLPDYDPSRTQVAILADPGAGTLSGASFQAYDIQSQSGHIIWNPRNTEAHVYIDQFLADSASNALPSVVCGDIGNSLALASVRLSRIGQADADQPAVDVGSGYDPLKVFIGDVYSSNPTPVTSRSVINGPSNLRSAYWNGSASPTASPWSLGWRTVWPGGSTVPHVGPNRALGTVQSRYPNLFPALANWVGGAGQPAALPTGITATQDGTGPDGSTVTAFKLVADNTYVGADVVIGQYPADGSTWVAGDYIFVGSWINAPVSDINNATNMTMEAYTPGDITFTGLGLDSQNFIRVNRNVISKGWQWCYKIAQVATNSNGHYFLKFVLPATAGTYLFYAPTVVRAPVSIGADDLAEWAGTMRHQSIDGPVGIPGTMDNQKFIAKGGLGVSSALAKTVGVGSGQLTLTGSGTTYVPIYAADGVTIQGWVAQLQATVNP